MSMHPVTVSDEYLEELSEWMIQWANRETSMILPQMYRERGLGHFYFAQFVRMSRDFKNAFEVVKSILCARWFELAFSAENLPPHKAAMVNRYLRIYDSYILDQEKQSALLKQNTNNSNQPVNRYVSQSYAEEILSNFYDPIYESNVNKRRDRKKT